MTRRVLVVRLDGAGDVLLAGPAVRAVAAAAGVEVLVLAGPAGAEVARLLPGVAGVLTWPAPWVLAHPPPLDAAALDALVSLVAGHGVDEAVVLTSFHQSPLPTAMALRLAGVARISGASVDYAGSLLDVRLRPGEDLPEELPEPDRALAIAHAAGYELPPGDDGRLAVRAPEGPVAATSPRGERHVVLHPGSAAPARQWPGGHFAELAELLAARGWRVVVTGDASERELTGAVAGTVGRDLGGCTDLAALAGVLRDAAAVVVGNTSAAHLAAAVGTPVVSLFSPVVPALKWRPYRVPQVLLGDQNAPCRDSRSRACPVAGHPCLAGVTPLEVADALHRLVGPPAPDGPTPAPGHRRPHRERPGVPA